MTNQEFRHTTVLLQEAVAQLAIKADGCYVDGTFGRGGHSRLILSQLGNNGQLFGFDKDPAAIRAGQQLMAEDKRFLIVQCSFAEMEEQLVKHQVKGKVAGVLLDLGVSSPQLDDATRGFSFSHDGPLDMRMNPEVGISASEWLAEASEDEISQVFKDYGEERFARRMAKAIVARRTVKTFTSTLDLAEVISLANPAWEKGKHPATRAFQAIRIYVNNELVDLEKGLQAALDVLTVGGRLAVISFHSLEDRIVKQFMRKQVKGEKDQLPRDLPIQVKPFEAKLRLVGKPIYASAQEIKVNPRSRSAVLRTAEKLR